MKDKTKIMALILSILCICVTGVICLVSFWKVKEADGRITALESEIQQLERTQMKTAESAFAAESESQSTQQTETESDSELETEGTESVLETETLSETEPVPETDADVTNGYTVAIDPGHQGSWVDMSEQEPMGPGSSEMKAKATTGTSGRYTNIPEYQLNLDVSLALQAELQSRGYAVVMTRTDNNAAISNAERATKAYQEGGDVYVRIHANGSEDTSISGALGMVPSAGNPYVGYLADDSYTLAECILNAYCAETGFGNLGVQYYDNMTGINWSQIPVMILEMGFMTNESDDTAMADEDMQVRMVNGIANGIDQYFGRE